MVEKEKYKHKYRIKSARLQSWDYRWSGAYFITICTQDNIQFFGEVIDGEMCLSHVGVIADVFWYEIRNHAKNVQLGNFVVMPNHVHGILIINQDVKTDLTYSNPDNKTMASISPKQGSVSSTIRSYKSAVTRHARRLGYEFSWQPRFHDHIIRNENSFNQIVDYINTNPKRWKEDKFYVGKNETVET